MSLSQWLPSFQELCGKKMQVKTIPGKCSSGAHVALVHGIAANAATWLPLMHHLASIASDFLLMDIPGHGRSPDPELPFSCMDAYACVEECLLRNLPPRGRNLLIGNSLGGAFALKFALEHPDRIDKCVFISPAGAPFPRGVHDVIDFFYADTACQALKIVERVWARPDLKAFLVVPFLLHTTRRPAFRSLLDSIAQIDDDPHSPMRDLLFTADQLREFHTSSLFFWGDLDHVLPREMRDFYDDALPGCVQRIFYTSFGHCPQLESPGLLGNCIKQWLNSYPFP